eukprot:scaffold12954_cov105-Isochrysis_galbana.AAC.7
MPDMHEQWTRPAVSKLQTGAMLLVSHNLTVASTALDTKAPVSWGNHCRHVTPDVWPAGHERLVVRTMGARASGGPLDMVGLSATSYSEMDASAHPASRAQGEPRAGADQREARAPSSRRHEHPRMIGHPARAHASSRPIPAVCPWRGAGGGTGLLHMKKI